jgi:hypothetical protein
MVHSEIRRSIVSNTRDLQKEVEKEESLKKAIEIVNDLCMALYSQGRPEAGTIRNEVLFALEHGQVLPSETGEAVKRAFALAGLERVCN